MGEFSTNINCANARPHTGNWDDVVDCDLLKVSSTFNSCAACPLDKRKPIDPEKPVILVQISVSTKKPFKSVYRGGPGTELKRLFSSFGFTPSSKCQCSARAYQMDRAGPDWCEEHIEEIVNWISVEWKRAHSLLPFPSPMAWLAVQKAVALSREKLVARLSLGQ